MNEEQFLKEHPSLKDKMKRRKRKFYEDYCYTKDIHETQLDKAQLKETLEMIFGWREEDWDRLMKAHSPNTEKTEEQDGD